jgi:hypothetical protein
MLALLLSLALHRSMMVLQH